MTQKNKGFTSNGEKNHSFLTTKGGINNYDAKFTRFSRILESLNE
jgi:hypothetical protein